MASKGDDPATLPELMTRLMSERSLVSYKLELTIHASSPLLWDCTDCLYLYECSQVGNHNIITRISNPSTKERQVMTGGRSGDSFFFGSGRHRILQVSQYERNGREEVPSHLDWRVVGLGICGDLMPGDERSRLEEIAGGIASRGKAPRASSLRGRLTDTKDLLVYRDSDCVVHFDKSKAFSPVLFEWIAGDYFSKRIVRYSKIGDHYLPESATLHCQEDVIEFLFRWSCVDEPIPVGIESAENLAKFLNFELKNLTGKR